MSWHSVRLVRRIARVPFHARRKLAITGDRHDADVIGSERVHNIEHVFRRQVCQRLGSTTLPVDRVPRRFGVGQRKLAMITHGKAGNRIVPAVRGKQKSAIWGQDDASRPFKGVGRALLAAYRLESSGAGTPSGYSLHLGKRPVRRPMVVDDYVLYFVGLHVEMSAA